jgi:hypothetical protein
VGWIDGKGVYPIPKVKGSNVMGGVVCGQQWYVDEIFSYQVLRKVFRLIVWPIYLPRLRF